MTSTQSYCTIQMSEGPGHRRQFVAPTTFIYDPEMSRFYIVVDKDDGSFIQLYLPEADLQAIKARKLER